MNDWATAARKFVRASQGGSLATHSLSHTGYPFASFVSFVPDGHALPVLLVSPLAEHSRNAEADSRASLMIQPPSPEPQSAARVTLMGELQRIDADETFVERYVRYLPQAERLLGLGDFYFVRLTPKAIRFIGGFGAIRWVSPVDYEPRWRTNPRLELDTLNQLKRDHPNLLQRLASTFCGPATQAEWVGLDCDGLQLRTDSLIRVDIPKPADDVNSLVAALALNATAQ